jgi:uncharacterized protein (UPF0262 family)
MAVLRRDNNYIVNVDLVDLLDKHTWKPKDSAGHPERRKINILDVMDEKDIEQVKNKNRKDPLNNKIDGMKHKQVDLMDVLERRTFKPKDSAGHPERRRINILDLV